MKFKKKSENEGIRFIPFSKSTVSLNAGSMLPKKDMINPLWTSDLFRAAREAKIYEDAVSNPVKKLPIDPKLVLVIVVGIMMFLIVGLPVLNQQGLLDLGGAGSGGSGTNPIQDLVERIVPKS